MECGAAGADLSSIGSGALSLATQRLCAAADQEVQQRLEDARAKYLQGDQAKDHTQEHENEEEEEISLNEGLAQVEEPTPAIHMEEADDGADSQSDEEDM